MAIVTGHTFASGELVTKSKLNTAVNAADVNAADVTATGSTTARTLAVRAADVVNVLDYGATGDGATVDSPAILLAIAALPAAGGVLEFPTGVYVIANVEFGLNFTSKTNFVIKGNNSTLKMENTAAAGNGVALWFELCQNGYIENLVLDGNISGSARSGSVSGGSHCLKVRSGNDLWFKNVTAKNSISDGFYLDTLTPGTASSIPTDMVFDNCVADNCYRNGLSAINTVRLRVNGGTYKKTTGALPQAGIDLEDDGTAGNSNAIIEDCRFIGNAGKGLQVSGVFGCDNVIVRDCYFEDNTEYALLVGLCRGVTLSDLTIGSHTAATRGIVDFISAATTDVNIKNLSFRNCNPGSAKYCLYVHSSVTGPMNIDGLSIITFNCVGFLISSAETNIQNVYMEGGDAGAAYSGSLYGSDRVTCRNVFQKGTNIFLFGSTADNSTMDGFTSIDSLSPGHLWFSNTAGGDVVANVTILQTSGISGTQTGITFAGKPAMISNVTAKATTGADFSGATVMTLSVGLANTTILEGITPGFYTKAAVGADTGDAAATLTIGINESTQTWRTALTAPRAVTLSTTNARSGDKWRIVRTAAATGSHNLNVGTGPLKALAAAGQYCEVEYDGSAWILTKYGSL